MTLLQTYHIFEHKKKLKYGLLLGLFMLIITNIALDYESAQFQNGAFYISESLLFSSFWVLFLPFLFILLKQSKAKMKPNLLLTGLIITVHLITYPALVWALSKTFYNHTFSYAQTFHFGLSANLLETLIIYSFAIILFNVDKIKLPSDSTTPEKVITTNSLSSLLISDHNKKVILPVGDIYYLTANSPYVNVHGVSKKYLHAETLKSIESQLDHNQFVRIHKSHIVNITKVFSIKSRKNGDYDITLTDHTTLRVSRSYAQDFKTKLDSSHRFTAN